MKSRFDKLLTLVQQHQLDAIALNPGPSLTYLTGLHFHLMERPVVFLVTSSGEMGLILPSLEQGKLSPDLALSGVFAYADDPSTWSAAFESACQQLLTPSARVGVEATQLRYLELDFLQSAAEGAVFCDAASLFADLRIQKEPEEIGKMREAARIAQEAMLATLKRVRVGMTEKHIANLLVMALLQAGSDPGLPFQPIVAVGENSANPHSQPSERSLQEGDLLLIDWGASFEGYYSDITRTFSMGQVDPELLKIGEIVLKANAAGRDAAGETLLAGDVDRAARAVITQAGYGEAFIHRTGHGLGMEAHEAPYIFGENDRPLLPGMVFTVEPGIYLAGRGGVRIEDDVVFNGHKLESLTDLSRTLLPLEDFMD